jgi:hypothetical protein
MRNLLALVAATVLVSTTAAAEVVGVTIASRAAVADGAVFGTAGAYERLSGTIEFALDPADPHNRAIVDLSSAPREADGRVHFTATLYVIRPTVEAKGNGVLLFEISNRGGKDLLSRFNGGTPSQDPIAAANIGDGFLMREGYTLVWVGWEFDVPPQAVHLDAPRANVDPARRLTVEFIRDAASPTVTLDREAPLYLPATLADPSAALTVRDSYWDAPTTIARDHWRFVASDQAPTLALDGGFAAGRNYAVTYQPTGARVPGAGMAAIRDAAAAFRYRTDLAVHGRSAYVYGVSQSGRFLRQFLHDGFNADERNRRAFDAVWAHVAGAAQGSFNETYAMPRHLAPFSATRRPFTDEPADGQPEGLLSRYTREQRPKIFYTNSPIEYWGNGRAAALTHASVDGRRDVSLPDNVRIYFFAGTQHGGSAPLPPTRTTGQQLNVPTPQHIVTRALLRAMHQWVSAGTPPPASRYPRLADDSLVAASRVRFPAIPNVGDPRRITGPALVSAAGTTPLPLLVPQVDGDGNEIAGIRVPDQSVPLATVTGWNFRAEAVGNPTEVYPLLGSYIPFARTRAAREAAGDPRRSIEERYPSRASYLQRIRDAANGLIKGRYLLEEDLPAVVAHAERHWAVATGQENTTAQK